MKKLVLVTVAVLASVGIARLSQAALTGSGHDLSIVSGSGVTQICIPCHTPHNADTSITDAPLWNHTATTASYTLYASPTFNAGPGGTNLDTITQPTGVSKLCLSCHDGTVAPDSFTGHTATMANLLPGVGNGGLGTDLKKSHPISFTYDTALVTKDGELHDPATLPTGWVNNGKFECSSCHDVHNKGDLGAMLHISNANSALCLKCHNK